MRMYFQGDGVLTGLVSFLPVESSPDCTTMLILSHPFAFYMLKIIKNF
jgi:hypothetical protein